MDWLTTPLLIVATLASLYAAYLMHSLRTLVRSFEDLDTETYEDGIQKEFSFMSTTEDGVK